MISSGKHSKNNFGEEEVSFSCEEDYSFCETAKPSTINVKNRADLPQWLRPCSCGMHKNQEEHDVVGCSCGSHFNQQDCDFFTLVEKEYYTYGYWSSEDEDATEWDVDYDGFCFKLPKPDMTRRERENFFCFLLDELKLTNDEICAKTEAEIADYKVLYRAHLEKKEAEALEKERARRKRRADELKARKERDAKKKRDDEIATYDMCYVWYVKIRNLDFSSYLNFDGTIKLECLKPIYDFRNLSIDVRRKAELLNVVREARKAEKSAQKNLESVHKKIEKTRKKREALKRASPNSKGGSDSKSNKDKSQELKQIQEAKAKLLRNERKALELKQWEEENRKAKELAVVTPKFVFQPDIDSEESENSPPTSPADSESSVDFPELLEPDLKDVFSKEQNLIFSEKRSKSKLFHIKDTDSIARDVAETARKDRETKLELKEWKQVSSPKSEHIMADMSLIRQKKMDKDRIYRELRGLDTATNSGELRTEAFAAMAKAEKKTDKELKCTRFCSSLSKNIKCNRQATCTFAHSLEELVQTKCDFRERCRRVKSAGNGSYINVFSKENEQNACKGFHPNETSESYFLRVVGTPMKTSSKPIVKNVSKPEFVKSATAKKPMMTKKN